MQLSNQGIVSCLLVFGCCRPSRCGGIRSLASFPAITVVESGQLLRVGSLIIRSNVPNNALLHTTDSLAENNYIPSVRRNPILQPNKYSWEYRIDRLSVASRDTRSQDKPGVRPGTGITNTNLFMKQKPILNRELSNHFLGVVDELPDSTNPTQRAITLRK